MKIGKSGIWFLGLLTLASFALQDNRTIIIEQFNRAQGTWEGFMEYTDERDNKTKYSMPAKCTIHFDGKRWEYEVQYDEGNGELAGGKGECTVNDDGSKMNYNGVIWNVTNVIQSGDSVKVVMETTGKDNRKKAVLKQTLEISSTTFSIVEEVKYMEGGDFFIRNRHLFRRKRGL